jgi:hypothetical protein
VDAAGQLEQALAAAALALEAGDPIGAAEASARSAQACAALESRGAALSPDELARCRALQERCQVAVQLVQRRLVGELQSASRSRRASDAYAGR